VAKAYDVVIAGGGVVGCAAALALSNISSLNIAVIESHPPTKTDIHPSFDARVIALANESLAHLKSWHFDIDGVVGGEIKRIHVSDRRHIGQVILDAKDADVAQLGKVVRLEELGLSLHHSLENNQSISTKLLVIAEGADSNTRKLVGLASQHEDYKQSAIITNVTMQLPHQDCAFERFTKYGPVAFLPMSPLQKDSADIASADKMMSVVWTCEREDEQALLNLPEHEFMSMLNALFGSRLGRIEAITPRFSYPLILKQSEDFSSHRCICIGNAAQSLHPIAGQGFNLGVRDIQDLVKAIQSAADLSDTNDVGSYAVTTLYKQLRKQDKQSVIKATDMLVRGFSNHYLPFVLGRNKALMALNSLGALKAHFAKFAMGQR
jgi:2-octaprenyl-6-methoxyphenol hydroxylase